MSHVTFSNVKRDMLSSGVIGCYTQHLTHGGPCPSKALSRLIGDNFCKKIVRNVQNKEFELV